MGAVYTIPRNERGQELIVHGTPLFPCEIFDRDLCQYITGEISPHWHPEMEIFLLAEGQAHIILAEEEVDLKPGEGVFINAGALHGMSCPPGGRCRYHSIVFDPAIISGAPGSAYDLIYTRPFAEQGGPAWSFRPDDAAEGAEIAALFEEAFRACEGEEPGYEFTVRSALSQILLILRKRVQEGPVRRDSQQELRMKQMLSWLDEHYMEQITVSQLADAVGICVRECQRAFAKSLHTTPMQYLIRRRITVAAELLISTDMPVSEAGLCCGFDNPSYFAKQFKRMTGMSPREYRRAYGVENP